MGICAEYLISGPRACFPMRPTCSWSLRSRPCTLSVSKRASLCAIGAHMPRCKNSVRGSRRRSRGRHHRAFGAIPSRCGPCGNTTGGTGRPILVCQPTTRRNGSGRRSERRRACCGEATRLRQSNRIRCSCLTAADENDAASGRVTTVLCLLDVREKRRQELRVSEGWLGGRDSNCESTIFLSW